MTRVKRPVLALIISLLSLASVIAIAWFIPPSSWLVEAGVLIVLGVGLWLGSSWIIGKRKWASLLTLFVLVTLLMNRWGILNWITVGLWMAVIGLISLIN